MICPYCQKEAVWTENKAIYGRNYGNSFMCYYCAPCNAYVGCHQNTRRPLGTMANAGLREWRKKTHAVIDPLWKQGPFRRGQVYSILKNKFGRDIHVGESDEETCKQIIEFIKTQPPKKGIHHGQEAKAGI
jgi:hypothetical protein